MAFENPPLSELRVPDTAGYANPLGGVYPGVVITTDIPPILVSWYGGTPTAAVLVYSDSDTMYWFDLVFSSTRIHGYVWNNSQVREFYREPLAADPVNDTATFTVPGLSKFQSGATFTSWINFTSPDTNNLIGAFPGRFISEAIRNTQVGGSGFTAETTLDSVTIAAQPGVRYRVVWEGSLQSSVAGDDIGIRLKSGIITAYEKRQSTAFAGRGFVSSMERSIIPIAANGFPANVTFSVTARRILGSGVLLSYGGADQDNSLQVYYA